jgi:small subunit ribosomal protein S16
MVVIDKRKSSKAGEYIEEVGFLNPLKKEKFLRKERINYWLSVGAKPSATVYNLLVSEKILEGKKIPKQKKSKKKPSDASASTKVSVDKEATADKKAMEGKEEKKPEAPASKEEKPKEEKKEAEKPVEEKKVVPADLASVAEATSGKGAAPADTEKALEKAKEAPKTAENAEKKPETK